MRLPGPRGLEHVRAIGRFARDPYSALLAEHRAHGPVFELGVSKFRIVYLLGPEANRLVMVDRADAFRFREAYQVLTPITGDTALIVSDGEESKRRRRLVMPAFHRQRVNAYLQFIVKALDDTLRGFASGQVVDIYQTLRATIRTIVIRSLFGENLARRSDQLGTLIQEMLDFVNRIFLPPPHVDLPGFAFHRFANARRELDRLIYAEIARRRSAPDEGDDVMALLLSTRDEGGDALSDVEVRDQVVSLIVAGFETTSSAVTWALYAMLKDRRIWEQAKSESVSMLGDAPIQIEHLAKLPYLDRVTNEALRLYPSVFIGVRKAVEPFELCGHRIPSGVLVAYSPYVTHRMAKIWPDPERFDPDRWDESKPGYREPTPYEYVPFGGGARRCIGQSFAILDLKVMLAELARRTELTLPAQKITPTGFSAMFPKEGIQVRIDSVRSSS